MSDKTLVERLREVRDRDDWRPFTPYGIADAIEREYLPRPLFEDGEPVKIGDKFENHFGKSEYIAEIQWIPNMRYALKSESGCYAYKAGERVKRPEPEVLDADGVPIKVGDTVWAINTGIIRIVYRLGDGWFYANGCGVKLNPLMYSHKQPDSLERIEEDALMDVCDYFGTRDEHKCDGCRGAYCFECNHEKTLDLLRRQREVLERGR